MQRNLITKVGIAVIGFAVFAAAGWAIGATTTHNNKAASTAPRSTTKLVHVPVIQLGAGIPDTPAALTYEAPKGAKPPIGKPKAAPAPAPHPTGATGASTSMLLPAIPTMPSGTRGTRPRSPDTDGAPATTTASSPTAPSSTARPGSTVGASPSSTSSPSTTTPPGVVDGCATEPRPTGCPIGIGGTVLPAGGDHPFLILSVEPIAGPGCPTTGIDRNHFPVTITSSDPGNFSINQTSDQTGQRQRARAATSSSETHRWSAADEVGEVSTCVLLAGTSQDRSFTLQIHGTPADDLRAMGVDFTTQITPALPGQAPVIFRPINDLRGELLVGSKPDELVDAVLVRRPTTSTESSCSSLDAEAIPTDFHPVHLADQRDVDGNVLSSIYSRTHVFGIHIDRSDLYDVCLTWKRDLQPHAQITEREAFTLQPPARPSVHLSIDDFAAHQPRAGSLVDLSQLLWADVDVTDLDGNALCNTSVSRDRPSRPLCDIPSTGITPAVRIAVVGRYTGSGPTHQQFGGRYEGVLNFAEVGCGATSPCNGTSSLPIFIPNSTTVSMGDVVLHVTSTNSPARASLPNWNFQRAGTFGSDAGSNIPDASPQLDNAATRFIIDPADPFHVTLHWKADRPATARVALSSAMFHEQMSCRRGAAFRTMPATGHLSLGPAEGAITFQVCPGSSYSTSIRLESTADHKVTWLLGPQMVVPDDEPAGYLSAPWSRGSLRTPTIALNVNFSTKFRKADWTGESVAPPVESIEPELAHVDWWIMIEDQLFSQSRRSGFIVENSPTCMRYPDFDLAPGELNPHPIRIAVGPVVRVAVEADYSEYAQCHSVTHAASGNPTKHGYVQGISYIGVYDLLHDGHESMTADSGGSGPQCYRCAGVITTDVQGHRAS